MKNPSISNFVNCTLKRTYQGTSYCQEPSYDRSMVGWEPWCLLLLTPAWAQNRSLPHVSDDVLFHDAVSERRQYFSNGCPHTHTNQHCIIYMSKNNVLSLSPYWPSLPLSLGRVGRGGSVPWCVPLASWNTSQRAPWRTGPHQWT